MNMRIAIPIWSGRISPVFDAATRLLVAEVADREVVDRWEERLCHPNALEKVKRVVEIQADHLICGAISQYNNRENVQGPKNYLSLLVNRATMQGMVVFDWADRYGEAARELGGWLAEGKIKTRESIYEGIENFPETFKRLFTGDKTGKLMLKVLED